MIEDIDTLRETVVRTVRAGTLATMVEAVDVEPARDDDDGEFLRIKLSIRLPDRDVDAELETLLEQIEEAVAQVDERYPSVRFLDAA